MPARPSPETTGAAAPERSDSDARLGVARLLPWIVAATLALAAAWLGRAYFASGSEVELLRDELALADVVVQSTRQQLEAERIISRQHIESLDRQLNAARAGGLGTLAVASLSGPADGSERPPSAVVLWDAARQEGVVVFERTPALTANETLELWLIEDTPAAAPISAGVLAPRTGAPQRISFKPTRSVGAVVQFLITRERNNGKASHATPGETVLQGRAR